MNKGYGIVLNEWLFDDRIKKELRLLVYISSLTAKNGTCFASNEHFAKKFGEAQETISRRIKKLIDLGFISAEYEMYGSRVNKRILTIDINVNRHCSNNQPTIDETVNRTVDETVKYNNTSNNNTSNKKESKPKKRSHFKKPTIEEIFIYLTEEKNKEKSFAKKESEKMFNYYESKGWLVGKTKMKNWKAASTNWINRAENEFKTKSNGESKERKFGRQTESDIRANREGWENL